MKTDRLDVWCSVYARQEVSVRRTQVLLDEWHYQALKQMAASGKKSVSAVIRDLVDSSLSKRDFSKDPLLDAIGIASGGRGSADIDRRLYAKTRR